MSRLMGLYAQHLSANAAPPAVDKATFARQVEQAGDVLADADMVVCGIGSGMSTACGYDHYGRSAAFDGPFAKFERAHGFSSLMDGFYHLYATNEERWGFLAAYIAYLENAPVGRAYRQLAKLLEGKEHFVLTTNVDGQVRRAFPSESVWLFQGDFGFLQCCQPCCDELVSALPVARAMLDAMGDDGVAVPSDLLPRCPQCGWLRSPWVRDHGFLEGEAWRDGKRRYERFVSDALAGGRRVVFLELGVGGMTPSIIEIPFWEMTRTNPNAFYLRVNMGKASEPRQLEGRSLTVTGDIANVFDMLTNEQETKEQDA